MTIALPRFFEGVKRKLTAGTKDALPRDEIDVIYLWKDDSDEKWARRKQAFIASRQGKQSYNQSSLKDIIVKPQLDELKYSLRSVEKHFKPLGTVHIVTDQQTPSWLNLEHPRLNLLDVADLVDKEYLPNYNSQAIESYFYTLETLSEHFVYFNDDFFLLKDVGAEAFFSAYDEIKVRLGKAFSPKGKTNTLEDADTSAHKNANSLLDKHFKAEHRFTVMHRPYALTKNLYKELFKAFPEAFTKTRQSQLRSTDMFAIHSFLLPYWAFYMRQAKLMLPNPLCKDMYYLEEDNQRNQQIFQSIRAVHDIGFCIQGSRAAMPSQDVATFFKAEMSKLYPEPSSFEKA